MKTPPHILIAQNDSAAHNYEAVLKHLAIPYTTTLSAASKASYDMLLLPGGGDISPEPDGILNIKNHTRISLGHVI